MSDKKFFYGQATRGRDKSIGDKIVAFLEKVRVTDWLFLFSFLFHSDTDS